MSDTFTLPIRAITEEKPYKMVFVCLGNICRSPTGEGLMQHLVNEAGLQNYFEIDSAGTSAWHAGEPANSKTRRVAESHGVEIKSRARQVDFRDLDYFDLVVAMDDENYDNLMRMAAGRSQQQKRICRLRHFDPTPEDGQVPDPYFGGLNGFENVYQIVKRSCEHLLEALQPQVRKKT